MTDSTVPDTGTEETQSTGPGLRDLIERTLLVGVGVAALTGERVQKLVEEFVRRGQLSADEGRELVDRVAGRSRTEARSVLKKADSSLQGAYRDMGLVTRREFEELDLRVRHLEHRTRLLEAEADSSVEPDGPAS